MYVAQNITESVNLWQEVVYPPVPALKISLKQMRSAKHCEHGGACFRSAARCLSSLRSENFERKVRTKAECLPLLLYFFHFSTEIVSISWLVLEETSQQPRRWELGGGSETAEARVNT